MTNPTNFVLRGAVLAGIAIVCGAAVHAYSLSSYKWASSPVMFYMNPANADVSASAAEAAIKTALNVWNTQGGAKFSFQYGGQVRDTSTSNDSRNVVIFRNDSNGGTIASTYSWWWNGVRVDSDVIFWDGGFQFFTGTSGCSSGFYIEDIATHEFGHSLGLAHSNLSTATMYPSTSRCLQEWRTLSDDDKAGIQQLYGKASSTTTTTTNTAPVVTIESPTSGSAFAEGTAITFAGSATDSQDGNISGRIKWASSLQGSLGSGATITGTLIAGTHTIRATVTDSAGVSASKDVSVSVTSSQTVEEPPPSTAPSTSRTLSARGYLAKGNKQKVQLAWSGFTVSTVDIYRSGKRIKAGTANDGGASLSVSGPGPHVFKVCDAGTTACSNEASVSF